MNEWKKLRMNTELNGWQLRKKKEWKKDCNEYKMKCPDMKAEERIKKNKKKIL